MLVGLVLRGVAFDFRVKARESHKTHLGPPLLRRLAARRRSRRAGCSGRYVSGFGSGWNYPLFAAAIALALPMAYVLMGACWLVMKTEGELQEQAVGWASSAWPPVVGGLVLISMATPWISPTVRERWFALPEIIALLAIPLMTGIALYAVRALLATRVVRGALCWLPFVLLIVVFVLGFLGLAYSIYPVCRHRPADDLAGREQPGRRSSSSWSALHLGAGDRRLYDLLVPGVPRQDRRTALRLKRRAALRAFSPYAAAKARRGPTLRPCRPCGAAGPAARCSGAAG